MAFNSIVNCEFNHGEEDDIDLSSVVAAYIMKLYGYKLQTVYKEDLMFLAQLSSIKMAKQVLPAATVLFLYQCG